MMERRKFETDKYGYYEVMVKEARWRVVGTTILHKDQDKAYAEANGRRVKKTWVEVEAFVGTE